MFSIRFHGVSFYLYFFFRLIIIVFGFFVVYVSLGQVEQLAAISIGCNEHKEDANDGNK